ncbi:MAG: retropepsin-like domain-containing protein [Armatimonadetes bacterium]|nr:retropepsin-like domain-containing protein [Armatimonadota bacterium]
MDTGATQTVVRTGILARIGYDLAQAPGQVRVTTASGVAFVPLLPLARMETLEQERTNFPVLSLALPHSADIDGLLGLDFIRGQDLRVNYRTGLISLE